MAVEAFGWGWSGCDLGVGAQAVKQSATEATVAPRILQPINSRVILNELDASFQQHCQRTLNGLGQKPHRESIVTLT